MKRINSLISGYEFTPYDIYAMQNMCAYEVCHPSPPQSFTQCLSIPLLSSNPDRRSGLLQLLPLVYARGVGRVRLFVIFLHSPHRNRTGKLKLSL